MLRPQQNRRGGLVLQASVRLLGSRLCRRACLIAEKPLVPLACEEVVSRRALGARSERWTAFTRRSLDPGEHLDAPLRVPAQALQGRHEVLLLAFEHLADVRLVAEDCAESQRDDGVALERPTENRVMREGCPLDPLEILEVTLEGLGAELLEPNVACHST